jgi:serine/threonine-protein kinase
MIAAIIQDPPHPVAAELGAHGDELEAILERALSKRPGDRFPSVTEFAAQLAALLDDGRAQDEIPTDPITRTSRRRKLHRRIAPPLAVAIALLVAGALFLTLRHAVAPDAPRGFRLVDLEPSPTVPAARESWQRAMRHLARGEPSASTVELERAIADDPEFASAHLQRLLYETYFCPTKQAIARPHFAAASRARDRLSARDRELLDALEPAVLDPPDLREVRDRLRVLAERHSADAQIWDALGVAENKLFHFEASARAHQKAIDADPGEEALGVLVLAQDLEDPERSRILDVCLRKNQQSEWCRIELSLGLATKGACLELEKNGRKMMAFNPESSYGPLFLANALAGQNASPEAITIALDDGVSRRPAAQRARITRMNQVQMALWSGDFAGAVRLLDEGSELDPAWAASMKVDALWESGDRRATGEAALAYLKRAAALPRFERPETDPLPLILARAHASGALSDGEFAARRDAWIKMWRDRLDDDAWVSGGPVIWGIAFVEPRDAAEAKAALAQLPRFGGLPPIASRKFWTHDGPVGDLLRLAGRLDDAIPRLRNEADRCSFDTARVRARFALGLALEQNRDTVGACDAYAAVVKQWGAARPRSVTADAASAREKALSCPSR